ncbi:MAG: TlpA family protein disulfide reductase [Candidatus Tectomicrobia bacterium]|nr:TlpA family protein disulfide reductase [Candidatus Tectomicrobia bacterium]
MGSWTSGRSVPVVSSKALAAEPGRLAPDFDLPALGGTRVRLGSLRGKVVLLNFWATWCPPCRSEMPSMEAIYQELKGPDFEILAVSIDSGDKKGVASFAKELKLTFPILLDPDMKAMERFGVRGLPTTFLIDRRGKIASVDVGPRDWSAKEMKERVQGLIGRRLSS